MIFCLITFFNFVDQCSVILLKISSILVCNSIKFQRYNLQHNYLHNSLKAELVVCICEKALIKREKFPHMQQNIAEIAI